MTRPRASWTTLIAGVVVVAALRTTPADAAVQTRASEAAVKAAYLFNFAQFVRWPDDAVPHGQAFTICVVGRDPFGTALDSTVARESIGGHRIAVKRLDKVTTPPSCQIAFVSASEDTRVDTVLDAFAATPTLTVSDMPRFIARGGMVQFVSIEHRVRFELNLDATETVKLVPSSELARVALAVHRTAGPARP
jgi:hypothetical protein